MNVKQEGLGVCPKCGTPIMQTINQPGIAGLCFGCSADGEPKTGRTVVVHESQEEKIQAGHNNLSALSRIDVVDTASNVHTLGGQATMAVIPDFAYNIPFNLDELEQGDCLVVLLKRLYDALDNSSFSTIKEAKRVMALQEAIQKKIDKLGSK